MIVDCLSGRGLVVWEGESPQRLTAVDETSVQNGFWAEEDDCIGCAEQLRHAVQLVIELGPRYYDMIEAARCVADQHSHAMLARRPIRFWQAFLEKGCFPSGL